MKTIVFGFTFLMFAVTGHGNTAERFFLDDESDLFDPVIEQVYLDYDDDVIEEDEVNLQLVPKTLKTVKPEGVSEAVWSLLQPYLMPDDHPIKAKLDSIFSKARVTLTAKTMKKAKFTNPEERSFSHTVVTRHPQVPGYILKLFRDDQTDVTDWDMCHRRCSGAQLIRKAIEEMGYENMFSVPDKWIYCLPDFPEPPPGYQQKHFIVVAQDMKILKSKDNHAKWRSSAMSHERLEALFFLVKNVGLSDSVVAFNIPFCKDGRNSFIDTEWYHRPRVRYERLFRFLSPSGTIFWQLLIEHYVY